MTAEQNNVVPLPDPLPCPWCMGTNVLPGIDRDGDIYLCCQQCHAKGPPVSSGRYAMDGGHVAAAYSQWNTRTRT